MTLYRCPCCGRELADAVCPCGSYAIPIQTVPEHFTEGPPMRFVPLLGYLDEPGRGLPQTLAFVREDNK